MLKTCSESANHTFVVIRTIHLLVRQLWVRVRPPGPLARPSAVDVRNIVRHPAWSETHTWDTS